MFAGNAMIVDVDFPQRFELAACAWEHCCCAVLGNGSVSEKKGKVEGSWAEDAILLGFHEGVQTKRIRLPDANIEGARLAISKPVFNSGNTAILPKSSHGLRGLCAHYSNCNQVWGTMAQPIDSLLAYTDESSLRVRRDDSELRRAFWKMVSFPMHIMRKHEDRITLSEGSLLDLLPDPVRLSGPSIRGGIFWFSGDATLPRVSCINWPAREFIRCPISDLLDPYMLGHQQSIIIADVELFTIIIYIVVW